LDGSRFAGGPQIAPATALPGFIRRTPWRFRLPPAVKFINRHNRIIFDFWQPIRRRGEGYAGRPRASNPHTIF